MLDPADPRLRAGGQTDGQVISVPLLSARLKHKETASGRGCRLRRWGRRETWVFSRFPERKQRRLPAGQGPHTLEGVTPGVERRQPRREPNAGTARCAAGSLSALAHCPLEGTSLEVMREELPKKENAFPNEARGGGVLCPARHSAWPHPCSIPTPSFPS